ncbi:MAG: Hsp20/alpha crystallin family protein [Phycisphaeraceae bacterium]
MLPTLRRSGVDPFEPFTRDIERMLGAWNAAGTSDVTASYPVDIREDDENIYVEAELPGFEKNEVDVTIENGVLTIDARRKREKAEDKGTQHLQERRFHHVRRSFTMPTSVDTNNVEASLDNGILKLQLHKSEEVRPRRIELK